MPVNLICDICQCGKRSKALLFLKKKSQVLPLLCYEVLRTMQICTWLYVDGYTLECKFMFSVDCRCQ